MLLAIARRLPRGDWWWRAAVLGVLNIGAFFVLVYVAAHLLPSGTAASIMSLSAAALALLAWLVLSERPRIGALLGSAIGAAGVCVMVWNASAPPAPLGIAASVAALLSSSLGFVLTKRWAHGEGALAIAAWQLLAGSLVLLPLAVLVEGRPPALDPPALAGAAFVSLVATALAYVAWFAALARLPAASIGLIGLLNPATGVLLGAMLAAEPLGWPQVAGLALVAAGVLLGQARPRAAGALTQRCRPNSRRMETPPVLVSSPSSSRPITHEGPS
jgi:probable blue pigment (indigoidine) exporter